MQASIHISCWKTTAAALFGALPLAFGFGAGAEPRQPLGIAIAGGLIVSQVLTLFTTPVIHLWFHRLTRRIGRRRRDGRRTGTPSHAEIDDDGAPGLDHTPAGLRSAVND